jgi:phosphomevalonate kinase
MNVVASAPGKIVISGEYAVLTGAPALVGAVNRRVLCSVRDATAGDWTFRTHGFAPETHHPLIALLDGPALPRSDPAHLCQHILRQLRLVGVTFDATPHVRVDIDSRAGFDGNRKLGIGTSAAVCTALTAALIQRSDTRHTTFPIALAAHRAAQGGRGSGIDVAAACHGGLVQFEAAQPPRSTRIAFPPGVTFAAIWTGTSADTREHVAQFEEWRAGGIPQPLRRLMDAAAHVADATTDSTQFMRQLRAFAAALRSLDDAAQLGIFTPSHRLLSELGDAHGVVYKPCGAGGGDLGMAFGLDASAMAAFERAASAAGFTRLPLELDEHGITVSIER